MLAARLCRTLAHRSSRERPAVYSQPCLFRLKTSGQGYERHKALDLFAPQASASARSYTLALNHCASAASRW